MLVPKGVQHCSTVYSKTSNNGPSEERTTSVQRTAHLPPIDFTIELIYKFRTSEKRTPLNSEQRTLISPQRTLANTKLPPKTDSGGNADPCRPLSLRHRCWIQRPSTIVASLRIVLAFLVSVNQQRGPKMRPHRAFNNHRLPRLPEVYRMPITDTSVFRTRSDGLASFS